jgi:hypothetical protein
MGEYRRLFTFPASEETWREFHGVEEWEAAAKLNPADVGTRMILCRVLASRGLFGDAIRHCEECLALQSHGGGLSMSRRMRIVIMSTRLKRAWRKTGSIQNPTEPL